MIPEIANATPSHIFILGDEYLEAAKRSRNHSPNHTNGPARLLAYHACELYLKTYLRYHGELIPELRAYQHDLAKMLDAACAHGLVPEKLIVQHLSVAQRKNDYVQVRYMVMDGKFGLRVEKAIQLAKSIRLCVRMALGFDKRGNSNGRIWAKSAPMDFPKKCKKTTKR